ncbi:MAG: hypothetical protein E6J91_39370 [Deltaproteobacteria bacterium]|nr:MAG: hypothetical protein E6J91_39370 [Deltaproteobacteria bacterium]
MLREANDVVGPGRGARGRPAPAAAMTTAEINELLFHFRPLLSRSDVVSIDVRQKTTCGKRTGDLAFVVGVVTKLPRRAVPAAARIPDRVRARTSRGIIELPTDVVEEGVIRALAQGGDVVQTQGLGRNGSLGVNITYQGAYRLLSCAHVLTAFDPQFVGAMIRWTADELEPFQDLVPVSGQMAVTYYDNPNEPNPAYNVFDLAWADITPALGDPAIKQIGTPAGIRAPVLNEQVRVYGAISRSLETTTVTSVTDQYRARSQSSAGQDIYTWWQNGIGLDVLTAAFLPGDSGSAVVATSDNMVVGLLANIGSITIRASPL